MRRAGSDRAGQDFVTAVLATLLWQWATYADRQVCADRVSLCIPRYGFAGLGLWLVLCPLVFFLALRPLGVVPHGTTVPASFFTQACTPAVLGRLSAQEYPETSVVSLAMLALGPALVAVRTVPRGGGWAGRAYPVLSYAAVS